MGKKRQHIGNAGLDFPDGLRALVGLKLANDILIFARAQWEMQIANAMVARSADARGSDSTNGSRTRSRPFRNHGRTVNPPTLA